MYFNSDLQKLDEDIEPFSLKALAVSKGKTALISEITPVEFEEGQEVKLKKIYPKILEEFKTRTKLRRYCSIWTVVGPSWNIREQRHYYMIRNGFAVFVWVTADQIEKVPSRQMQIVEGAPDFYSKGNRRKEKPTWVPTQRSLGPEDREGWEAKRAEEVLFERLQRRKQ